MAIFISYSRKDGAHVRRLHDALRERGRETWVDWEGIAPSADWMREIHAAIDSAEAFVFVLSPDSLRSPVCGAELAHAIAQHKRLLPVVVEDPGDSPAPPELVQLNWIFLRSGDAHDSGVDLLLRAIDTDLEWVREHTRLLVRSREWEARALDTSRLLRGADLDQAEQWLAKGPDRQPPPTAAQTRYVLESRRHASRRRIQLLGGATVALVAVTVLGTLSVLERRQAQRQETISQARRLAAAAERTRELQPSEHAVTPPLERSLQLAAEAVRRLHDIGERSLDADLALRRALAVWAEPVARLASEQALLERDRLQFSGEQELLAIRLEPPQTLRWQLQDAQPVASTPAVGELDWASMHVDAATQWVAYATGTSKPAGEAAVELRNARNLEPVARWTGLPAVAQVAVGPGGVLAMRLDLGRDRWQTRVHAPLAQQPAVVLPGLRDAVFSRDGRWFAGAAAGGFLLWSVDALLAGRDTPALRLDAADAWRIAFVDNDQRIVTWQGDPRSLALRRLDGSIERQWAAETVASVSPDGRWWLSRADGPAVTSIIEAVSGATVVRLFSATSNAPFAWSADSTRLALGDGDAVAVWRLSARGSALDATDVGADAADFAFGSDETGFFTLHRRGTGKAARWFVERRAWASGQRLAVVDLGPVTRVHAFSADGARLALGAPGPLRVHDLSNNRMLREAADAVPAAAVALSRNGRYAAAIGLDGTLLALDVDDGRTVARAQRAASAVDNRLAISDDGRTLSAIHADGNVRVGAARSLRRWDVQAIAQPASQPIGQKASGLAAQVCALAGSGDVVAVNSSGSALRVRDTRSGRDIATVDEAGNNPLCALSADDRLLATTGVDGTLRIWDLARQEEIARMELPARPLAFAFSPSSRHVAALDSRGVVRRWPLQPADLVAQACSRLRANMSQADWSRFMLDQPYRATCASLPKAAAARE